MIQYACFWCNHIWVPRKDVVSVCPNCHTPYWATIIRPLRTYMTSDETRKKISDALKGRPHSKEHNEKVSASLRTPENRERARRARLGFKVSPATRLKLSLLKRCNQNMKGKHQPLSQRKTTSMKLTGIKRSEKTKAYISDSGVGKHALDKNPAWKGGVAYEPYCPKFNFAFKERVREFFGRRCVVCGEEERNLPKRLDVHHVTSNKNTCCDASTPMFVVLCRSCHSKVRHHSDLYEEEFVRLINTKYNGKCFMEKAS